MNSLSLIIVSFFAAIGILAVGKSIIEVIFRREFGRFTVLIPLDGDSPPGEVIRLYDSGGARVVGVDYGNSGSVPNEIDIIVSPSELEKIAR